MYSQKIANCKNLQLPKEIFNNRLVETCIIVKRTGITIFSIIELVDQGRPQDLGGGGQEIFSDLGICMSRSDMLRMAKPCALLGGFRGMPPREIFLKWCNLVRFRVYFDQILSLFFSKNAVFYVKNKYFRYTFVMGYFS